MPLSMAKTYEDIANVAKARWEHLEKELVSKTLHPDDRAEIQARYHAAREVETIFLGLATQEGN